MKDLLKTHIMVEKIIDNAFPLAVVVLASLISYIFFKLCREIHSEKNLPELLSIRQFYEKIGNRKTPIPNDSQELDMFTRQGDLDACDDDSSPSKKGTISEQEVFLSIMGYVHNFLGKPNSNIGRKGPTCPFVPGALKSDSIYISIVASKHCTSTEDTMASMILQMMDKFKVMEPMTGPERISKAIIMIFPEISPFDVTRLIDGVQKKLKPKFVEEGLMIGEFHSKNNQSCLRNESFYPLRTPYPCLAIRHMVPSDIVFLYTEGDGFPISVRRKMLETFLGRFQKHDNNELNNTKSDEVGSKELVMARQLLADLD